METVLGLAHLNTFFLLQIVGSQGSVSTARVNDIRLVHVREESHNVLFLVVELNKKLARPSVPDTDCSILSASKDIISIGVNGGDCTSVGLCDVPELGFSSDSIETAKESISITNENGVVILGKVDARSGGLFCRIPSEQAFVFREFPHFYGALLIDSYEGVAILAERDIVNGADMSIRV